MADQPKTPSASTRLVRGRPRPLALEQRFVFDGAAADAVDTVASQPVADPAASDAAESSAAVAIEHAAPAERQPVTAEQPDLFRPDGDHPGLAEATASAAEQIRQFLAQASDAQLFELFKGEQSTPSEQWRAELARLRTSIADGTLEIGVSLLDNAQIKGAMAAYAAEGPDGAPVIFLNRDWLAVLDTQQVSRLLIEEYGHHLDNLLNQGGDTAGDEGQRFAAEVSGIDTGTPGFAVDNDHATLQFDGESVSVEFATLTFSNAYEVNTATTPAGKEANNHDFVFTSLGQVTVNDATNSRFFSGNDVSATAVTIGSTTYYGWISRPIKSGGVVRGFYFWTDADFTSLALAQSDGNQDGDSNVADNRGFLLVVDQAWFDSLGWKSQVSNLKNVGSSSDRVDAALNALVGPLVAPVAVADTANGTAGTSGGAAVEAGGSQNGTAGSAAIGNVLGNDTSADTKQVTAVGTGSASQAVNTATTSANGTVVVGLYGTLTLGADGSYRYVVNDANPQVEALRSASDTLVDTFTYRMTDASGMTSTTTLKVTIRGANDAPLASDDYSTAKESLRTDSTAYNGSDPLGSQAVGNVLTNDVDVDRYGETKTVVIISIEGGATGNTGGTTTFNTTLDSNDANSISIGAAVYRLNGDGTRTQLFSNGSPVTVASKTGSGSTIGFTFSDASALSGITRFSVMKGNGTFVDGTINSTTVSSSTTLALSGMTGNVAVGMTVYGTGLATAPTITSINYDSNGQVTSVVLSAAVALNNQALTFGNSTSAGVTLVGQYGSLLLNADGSYVYTPTANNPALSAGQSAVERFQYQMRDASGVTSSASLYITVLGSGTNDPNAVADTALATEQGGTANGTPGVNPTGNLLSNDTTPSGTNQIVTARASSSSASTTIGTNTEIIGLYGKLTLSANGAYTYVVDNSNSTVQALRDSSATLTDTFVYTLENGLTTNGVRLRDSSTFTVTIRGANDAPVAVDTSAAAVEASGVSNGVAGYNPSGNVLTPVTDVDDVLSELRVTAVRLGGVEGSGSAGVVGSALAGLYGSLTLDASGNWTYVLDNNNSTVQALNPGQTLIERFNYTVTDRSGSGLSDIAVLTITIEGAVDTVAVNSVFVNEASPYAVFTVSGSAGVAVSLALSDSDGLPASDTRASLSGGGADIGTTLEYFNGSAWVSYTPDSSVVIPSGDKLLVRVAVNQDNIHEGNESFTLIATTGNGDRSIGVGTINDEGEGDVYLPGNTTGTPDASGSNGYPTLDDHRPTLSVSNVSVTEGDYAEFVVSLDKPSTTAIGFSPVLVSGTANIAIDTGTTAQLERFDGNGWVVVNGPVSIAPGELSVRLRIATVDDSFVEPDETFSLRTGPVSGTVTNLAGAEGVATLQDNDVAAPSNHAPVAVDDNLGATEDTPVTYSAAQLIGNDGDIDGDSLSIASVTSGTGGTAVLNQDGTVTFTPAPDFNGVATFTYTVTDGNLVSNTATVTIVVAAVNDPAVIGGTDTGAVTEDLDVDGQGYLTIGGALTISDPDTGEASFQGSVTPSAGALGTLTIAPDGTWAYSVPNALVQYLKAGETKVETFTVQSVDGTQQTVTVTILGVNDAAVIGGSDTGSVTEDLDVDSQGDLITGGVLTIADPDTGEGSFQGSVTPSAGALGTLTIAADGTWIYSVPNALVQYLKAGETKVETFTVTTLDGTQQTVTVTIHGVNDAAVIGGNDTGSVIEDLNVDGQGNLTTGGSLTITDPDTDETSFYSLATPSAGALGTLSIDSNGTWSYSVPNALVQYLKAGETKVETFTVQSVDGTQHTITVTILGVNDEAVIGGTDSGSVTEDLDVDGQGDLTTGGVLTIADPDTGEGSFQGSVTPSAGALGTLTIAPNGTWTYSVPNAQVQYLKAGETKVETFTVSTLDGTQHTITVTIHGVNDAAVIGGTNTGSVTEDLNVNGQGNLTTGGSLTVTDADTGEASFQATVTPSAGALGTLTIAPNGTWTYSVPNALVQYLKADETKVETFTVTALDGTQHTVSVTIHGVNDAAVIGGTNTGSVTEDLNVNGQGSLTTGGSLTVTDSDTGEASFQGGVTPSAGALGTLTIAPNGTWTYSVPNALVQYLKAGEIKVETFTVTTLDGTQNTISVTIHGVNDAAVIGGTNTGSVTEDLNVNGQGNLTTGGSLTVTDSDTGEASFQATVTRSAGALGTLTIAPNGTWTYSVPNTLVQYLKAGETKVETFTVTTLDGTQHTVSVTIHGVNDAAVIGGTNTGSVTEDLNVNGQGNLTTGGSLTVTDADTGEASFQATVTPSAGALGTLSIAPNGTWTYSVPNALVQYLKAGETKVETFTVSTLDGTQHTITVTIHGVNDAAVFAPGGRQGYVQEDARFSSEGRVSVADGDQGEAIIVAQTAMPGLYGQFSIDAAGFWRYELNNADPVVQALGTGDTRLETFTVTTLDGSSTTVTVVVQGLDEPVVPAARPPVEPPPVLVTPPQPAPAPIPAPAIPDPVAPPAPPTPFNATVLPANNLSAPSPVAPPLVAAVQSRELDLLLQARGDYYELYTQRGGFQMLVIEAPQPRLSLYHGIADQYAETETQTSFSVPYDAFAHTDPNERILLSATLANGQRLPAWVRFDPRSGKFELVAPAGYRGELNIKVVARDSQGREASALFRFNVGDHRAAAAGSRGGLSDQLRQAAALRSAEAQVRAMSTGQVPSDVRAGAKVD
ncbi:VCBS domain-containing protein [Pseudomonas indica]|uniref:VCBS repeat-containing protein n=2 Tax=Pseudomonas indica TaxID=137658 RepID=A0A1G9E1H7_9PSED|nr:VCBS domain-containing protein [Pseudomonas indica]SDK69957.1 VCBS repeat-containing protein [Pseudomonas indica]